MRRSIVANLISAAILYLVGVVFDYLVAEPALVVVAIGVVSAPLALWAAGRFAAGPGRLRRADGPVPDSVLLALSVLVWVALLVLLAAMIFDATQRRLPTFAIAAPGIILIVAYCLVVKYEEQYAASPPKDPPAEA